MIFTKGAHHSAKFQTFDCSGEISPNLYFDRLLLLKLRKVSTKKSTEEICFIIPKSGAKFKEKPIFCFKNDKNLVNFDTSTKMFKKIQLEELYFLILKSHAKFEKKTNLWFGK